jgi:hypothetical protein
MKASEVGFAVSAIPQHALFRGFSISKGSKRFAAPEGGKKAGGKGKQRPAPKASTRPLLPAACAEA